MLYMVYNGVTLGDRPNVTMTYFINSYSGLDVPQANIVSQTSPMTDGTVFIDSTFGARTILIYGNLLTQDTATEKQQKAALDAAFGGNANNYINEDKTLKTLQITSDGGTRYIDCIRSKVEFPFKKNTEGYQKFIITLYCPSPYFYGDLQEVELESPSLPPIDFPSAQYMATAVNNTKKYIILVTNGFILKSFDGINWTNIQTTDNYVWRDVHIDSDGRIVAVGNNAGNGYIIYSLDDGTTWTYSTYVGTSEVFTSITKSENGNRWVIVGESRLIIYCDNNQFNTWNDDTFIFEPTNIDCNKIAYSEDQLRFIAVGGGGNQGIYSTNGLDWDVFYIEGAYSLTDITPIDEQGLWVASTEVGKVFKSDDNGLTWDVITAPQTSESYSIVYNNTNNTLVMGFIDGTYRLAYSTDYGDTWTLTDAEEDKAWNGGVYVDYLKSFLMVNAQWPYQTILSVNGINWYGIFTANSTIKYAQITNAGTENCPIELEIYNAYSGLTTDYIVVTNGSLYDGSDTQDYFLKISLNGVKKGFIKINSAEGIKTITQFNESIANKYLSGSFFGLFTSNQRVNNVYVYHSEGITLNPILKYRPFYLVANI